MCPGVWGTQRLVVTNTHLKNLRGRNWLVADFKNASMGASSTSTDCKALLCVSWGRGRGSCGRTSLRLLKLTLPKRTLGGGEGSPMKEGVVINSQPKFKLSMVEVSGARQDREISTITAVTHIYTDVHMRTCTHAYVYTHTHTHTHTHTLGPHGPS